MSAQIDPSDVPRMVQRLTVAATRYSDRAGAVRGMHRTDLHALEAVESTRRAGLPALTASHLADALGLTPSATTALIDRLERVGHVRREPDEIDRRRTGIHMTESADAEAGIIFVPLARCVAGVAAELTADELAVVSRFLDAAAEAIERQPLPQPRTT